MMASSPENIQTTFTQDFNIDYPIVSAPMFLVSNTKMVQATNQAGGLGTFPALNYRPIKEFRRVVQQLTKSQCHPFGVNIIVQNSNKARDEQIEICIEEEVDLIITSLGNPQEVLKRCKGTKTRVYCDVINYRHARKVIDYGAHGLIAVGYGAGGHAGTISPFALIPYLRKHTSLPIIAAGSIVNGAGMAAALALGADAVYMGTRFIASQEAKVSQEYKQAIISSQCEDIINTDRVDGFPGNFILTESLKRLNLEPNIIEQILRKNKKIKRLLSLARASRVLLSSQSRSKKSSYKTVFSAGHGVGLIDQEKTITEIIHETVREYHSIKKALP